VTVKTLEELDLPFLQLESPEFAADPYGHFAKAREQHPWLARSNFGLVVHQLSAIRELFIQDDRFRPAYDGIVSQLDAHGTPWGRFTENQLISLPAEKHQLLRGMFATRFTPAFANRMRETMRGTITRLLDEWAPRGEFDFEEFSSNYPISVMFNLVGAPQERLAGIRADLETLGLAMSLDKARMPEIQKSIVRLDELVQSLVEERLANPASGRDDLLELLINAGDEGGITARELADVIMFFFIAGYDTTKNVMTFTMHTLLDYPHIYQRCAVDLDYCRKVIEEALRYFNPGSVARFTNEDIVFRDVLIPADSMVFFTLNVAGRDPTAYADADVFDPDREVPLESRHVAFGLGRHMCLGQHIARAQMQEAFHKIAQRLPEPELAGDYGWRPYPGAWGLKGLPLRFRQG